MPSSALSGHLVPFSLVIPIIHGAVLYVSLPTLAGQHKDWVNKPQKALTLANTQLYPLTVFVQTTDEPSLAGSN
jgi:hypothetical protein